MLFPTKVLEWPAFDLLYLREQLANAELTCTPEVAIEKYRSYLAVCKGYPNVSHTPSRDVQAVASAHRSDAARYKAHCMEYFGTPAHRVLFVTACVN